MNFCHTKSAPMYLQPITEKVKMQEVRNEKRLLR